MKEEINRRRKHVAIGGGPRLAATVQASVQPDRAVVEPTKRYTTLDGKVYGPEVVDQPTGPHPIGAKRAKALTVPIGFGHGFSLGLGTRKGGARFSKIFFAGKTRNIKGSGGGVVNFFRQVLHPGTAGLGFLQGTVERVEQPLNGLLDGLIRDEVARLDQGGG